MMVTTFIILNLRFEVHERNNFLKFEIPDIGKHRLAQVRTPHQATASSRSKRARAPPTLCASSELCSFPAQCCSRAHLVAGKLVSWQPSPGRPASDWFESIFPNKRYADVKIYLWQR